MSDAAQKIGKEVTGYVDPWPRLHVRLLKARVTAHYDPRGDVLSFDAWPHVNFALEAAELEWLAQKVRHFRLAQEVQP